MHGINSKARDDFHGLSPDQMTGMLYHPFESPHLVEFSTSITVPVTDVPAICLFEKLVNAIGEKGLKPTTTGNLPVSVVRGIAMEVMGGAAYAERTRYG